jgi:hypothetical protein
MSDPIDLRGFDFISAEARERVRAADAHAVTREFEHALCDYTGARFAVTTTSCTQAILMALAWTRWSRRHGVVNGSTIEMPRLSYVGVPAALRNAGFHVVFRDEDWQGEYQFVPTMPCGAPALVWDSARRFTSGMYPPWMPCNACRSTGGRSSG